MNIVSRLETLWRDSRYGFRSLIRTPGFTAVALLSLALGIGATTAIFSVIYGVLISPYPYKDPDHIWAPGLIDAKTAHVDHWHTYSVEQFEQVQQLPAVSAAMATAFEGELLTGGRTPQAFDGILLSANAFQFLGVPALLGRTLQPSDVTSTGDAAPVIVLSYQLWQHLFAGDPRAIGSPLVLNGTPRTVVGVMPPRFGWFGSRAMWLPLPRYPRDRWALVIVRLRPGMTATVAAQQLHALNLRWAAKKPVDFPRQGFHTVLTNYMDMTVASGEMRSSLLLLFAAVGLLLLIACANVANLQLARTTSRAQEIAVRLSIGAGRRRVITQLLTESTWLSLAGGALGVGVAIAATKAIVTLMPDNLVPNEARIAINSYVLLFSLLVSILTGILFGLAPALQCSRANLTEALKDGGRGSGSSSAGRRTRSVLVVSEVAFAVFLLAGSSLAIRTFVELEHVNLGFNPEHVLTVGLLLPSNRYKTLEQRNAFARDLLERVKVLPGVQAAATGNGGVLYAGPDSTYAINGQPRLEPKSVHVNFVSADYLRTIGTRLLRGRPLTEAEVQRGVPVALVNQTAARLWRAGEDALGSHISVDILKTPPDPSVFVASGSPPQFTVVGIIADTRNWGLKEPTQPAICVPYTLLAPPFRELVLRTSGEPNAMITAVQRQVQSLDAELPIANSIPLTEFMGGELLQPKFNLAMFSLFAVFGLALATAGVYSVVSYYVTRRTQEIGLRIALGARALDVLHLVLTLSARLVLIGLAAGLIASFIVLRLVRTEIFSTSTLDARSVLILAATLSAAAAVASYLPARRAMRLDPMSALRHE